MRSAPATPHRPCARRELDTAIGARGKLVAQPRLQSRLLLVGETRDVGGRGTLPAEEGLPEVGEVTKARRCLERGTLDVLQPRRAPERLQRLRATEGESTRLVEGDDVGIERHCRVPEEA